RFAQFTGLADTNSEEALQIRTIGRVTALAASSPLRSWKSSSGATAAALSHDGQFAAVGYATGDVLIFRIDGVGASIYLQGAQPARVEKLAFSPDDSRIASASGDQLLLWDLSTKTVQSLCHGRGRVTDLAFDPGRRFLAWSAEDGEVTVMELTA